MIPYLLAGPYYWDKLVGVLSTGQTESQVDAVENLGLLVTPFGQGLRALASTWDDLRSLWSRSNLHASQSKPVFHRLTKPSQRKLSDVH